MCRDDRLLALGLFRTRPHRELIEAALNRGITALDTAGSYHDGQAHQLLSAAAGDLLERFRISTKLSVRAGWPSLHEQAWRGIDKLGTRPEVLLLHNPEHVLRQLPGQHSRQRWWAGTAASMAELVERGACRAWGVASWDPRPLVPVLTNTAGQTRRPEVVMIRAGLLVPAEVRTALDTLLDQLPSAARWGMSPFAGNPRLLDDIPLHVLLASQQHQAASRWQIAVAAAWQLPAVSRLAVGARAGHLDELVTAADLLLDRQRLTAFRRQLAPGASAR